MFVQNTYNIFWFSESFCETDLMIAFIVTSLFSYCLLLLLKCTTVWVWNVLNIKSLISIFLIFCSSTHFYSTNLVLWADSTSWFFSPFDYQELQPLSTHDSFYPLHWNYVLCATLFFCMVIFEIGLTFCIHFLCITWLQC